MTSIERTIVKVKTGSLYEEKRSYSRAVVLDNWIMISNTAGRDYQTRAISEDAKEQTEQCFKNIEGVLAEVGSELADVVRIRVAIPDLDFKEDVMAVVARKFKGIDPASTVTATPLAGPEYKVEIEMTAFRGASRRAEERRRVLL